MATIYADRSAPTDSSTVARGHTDAEPEAGLHRDGRAVSEALGELVRILQFRDRDRACCYDLSVSQCYALKRVVDGGGATVNELSAALYLDKSTASRIANGLVDQGLVSRERDPADGRIVCLVATAEGTDVHARIERDLAREYAELLRDFDPEVRSAMPILLERLARSFASRVDTSGGSCCSIG